MPASVWEWLRKTGRALGAESLAVSGRNRAVEDVDYVVLDTELTGLDLQRDSLISIGAVRMAGTRIFPGSAYYRMVRPQTQMKKEAILVHGITPQEVAELPPEDSVLAEFLDYCGGAVLVGHFITIDRSIIDRQLRRLQGHGLRNLLLDTRQIHRWLGLHSRDAERHYTDTDRDCDLFSLARQHDIPISGAHNALADAYLTAQLFQRYLRILPRFGVNTLGALARIAAP